MRLNVYPDACDLCGERVPVTHFHYLHPTTGQMVEDKICAMCGLAFESEGLIDKKFIDSADGEIEYDPREENL